jgi:hypothetical protein
MMAGMHRTASLLSLVVILAGCAVPASPAASTPGAPECKMGSRGNQTCGYNCKLGSDGDWYCASRPDGQCALNATGSWTCP